MDGKQSSSAQKCFQHWSADKLAVAYQAYKEQFVSAFYCKAPPEEQAGAGGKDWFLQCLSLFWKMPFAFVPPGGFREGLLRFWCALAMTDEVTAIAGDMATVSPIARSPDVAVARSLGRSIGRSIARSIARLLDRPIARSLGFSIARSLDRSVAQSLVRSVAR